MAFSDTAFRWLAITFSADGIVESLSTSAEEITGYSAAELIGKPITHVLGDRSVFEIPHMIELAREWGTWEGEIGHRDRSGAPLVGHASLAYVAGSSRAAAHFALVTVLANGTALQAPLSCVSVEAVGTRLRALAHELNNPLAVIMGFAQLILLNAGCTGKIRADMEKLFSEVERLTHVSELLHAYARSLQGPDREADAGAAVVVESTRA